jgi:phage-related protein (TIGR01555 family)
MGQRRDHRGRFVIDAPLRDGLANLVSGAGTTADKRTYGFYTQPFMLPEQIEASYRSSWFVQKGVDLPPFDMTRARRDWQLDEADVTKIEAEEKRLQVWTKLREALTLGRLGGGLIVMGVGTDPTIPLAQETVGAAGLKYLHVMNRWQVTLGPIVTDPDDPLFCQPSFYRINFGKAGAQQVTIHPSRVITFKGKPRPNLRGTSGDDWFWGDSVLVSAHDAVRNADAAMNGFASLIEEAKLDTVSIPGLTATLATTEGEQLVTRRVQVANALKSTHNTRILDGGKGKDSPGEEWDTRQVTWTGMPDMIRVYAAAVAGAFDIPATRFLGKSPDGMNATGTGDESNYIAKIRADQDAYLRPALDQLDAVMLPSAGVEVTDEAWYDFPPLQEMSELDKSTIFKNRVEGIAALEAMNVIPTIAFEKAVQHTAVEEQWLSGLDGALAELPEDERFPSLSPPGPDDLEAVQGSDPLVPATALGRLPTIKQPGAATAANDGRKRWVLVEEVDDGSSRPFDDGFNPDEPRGPDGKWTGGLAEHVEEALTERGSHRATSLGQVSHANASAVLQHTGIDIAGHERIVGSSEIRHAMKSHGDPAIEARRGQVAIEKSDFGRINEIVGNAHTITAQGSRSSGKGLRLNYTARVGAHEYTYTEQVRGGQIVALKSMRKK